MTRSVMLSFLQNITGGNFKTSTSKKRAAEQNGNAGADTSSSLVLHFTKDAHNNLVLSNSSSANSVTPKSVEKGGNQLSSSSSTATSSSTLSHQPLLLSAHASKRPSSCDRSGGGSAAANPTTDGKSNKMSVQAAANIEGSSTLAISNASTASSGSGNQQTKTDSGLATVKEKKRKGPTGSRLKKFYRHFQQLSTDEQVINYFSCALVSDILLQGHLYITERHFAFYSNVFGFVTRILIPISSVEKISKEKTVKIIPNAIGVATADERHVFGSFISRESAYRLMISIWKPDVDTECAKADTLKDIESSSSLALIELTATADGAGTGANINNKNNPKKQKEKIVSSTLDIPKLSGSRSKSPESSSPNVRCRRVVEVSESIEEDSSSAISSNESPSGLMMEATSTTVDARVDGEPKSDAEKQLMRSGATATTYRVFNYEIPATVHIVYLLFTLIVILLLSASFMTYQIYMVDSSTETLSASDVDWRELLKENTGDKAGELLHKWQKEMQEKSLAETKNIVTSQLDQLDKIQQNLEALSVLLQQNRKRSVDFVADASSHASSSRNS